MEATLINVFIVPPDREDEFLECWEQTAEIFRKGKGLLEAHLHRNTGDGDGTFGYVNIARWVSAAAWRAAHDKYPPGEYRIPGVIGHPSIFVAQRHVYGYEASERDDGHWLAGP